MKDACWFGAARPKTELDQSRLASLSVVVALDRANRPLLAVIPPPPFLSLELPLSLQYLSFFEGGGGGEPNKSIKCFAFKQRNNFFSLARSLLTTPKRLRERRTQHARTHALRCRLLALSVASCPLKAQTNANRYAAEKGWKRSWEQQQEGVAAGDRHHSTQQPKPEPKPSWRWCGHQIQQTDGRIPRARGQASTQQRPGLGCVTSASLSLFCFLPSGGRKKTPSRKDGSSAAAPAACASKQQEQQKRASSETDGCATPSSLRVSSLSPALKFSPATHRHEPRTRAVCVCSPRAALCVQPATRNQVQFSSGGGSAEYLVTFCVPIRVFTIYQGFTVPVVTDSVFC